MPRGRAPAQRMEDELQFFEEPHDAAEEYLEALVMLEQQGEKPAAVSSVARMLGVKPPSVVQMLHRLDQKGLVEYGEGKGIRLAPKGRRIGRRMVRNGRLMEVFITKKLKLPLDVRLAHTVEHSMTDDFADALCTLLRHPTTCPHQYPIPSGRCCP